MTKLGKAIVHGVEADLRRIREVLGAGADLNSPALDEYHQIAEAPATERHKAWKRIRKKYEKKKSKKPLARRGR